jgi:8-oxo-dGTP pyrophosphatase MutT (NUDIX family)
VPVFGDPTTEGSATIRPSAYGIISDGPGRYAVVRTALGLFLPGGGSDATEVAETTVVRETREECGLAVRVGAWRRTAIEHVFSVTEQEHFEKRSTFCDATVVEPLGDPTENDHALEWLSAAEAIALLTPASHRWAIGEWLASGARQVAATDPTRY